MSHKVFNISVFWAFGRSSVWGGLTLILQAAALPLPLPVRLICGHRNGKLWRQRCSVSWQILAQWLVWVWQWFLSAVTRAASPKLLSSRLGESSTPGSGAAWGCNISHINHLQPLLGTFINNQQSVSLVKINHVTLQFLNFLLGLELHFHIQGIQLHVITELVKMCD